MHERKEGLLLTRANLFLLFLGQKRFDNHLCQDDVNAWFVVDFRLVLVGSTLDTISLR
jgi:hypothetical protein